MTIKFNNNIRCIEMRSKFDMSHTIKTFNNNIRSIEIKGPDVSIPLAPGLITT